MQALILRKNDWEGNTGFEKAEVPDPVITKDDDVIIKVHYAGVCGTDKGIWHRQAFKDAILNSTTDYRIIGHEFFGEVKEVGSKVKNIKPGDFVACESHVVCNKCFQCLNRQKEVCTNEKILGISHDGGFAEYAKVPAHIVWKTDTAKIRPEVAAMQEPFGNAVHAASKADAAGKTVVIFGLGPIGLFLTLVVKGMGAKSIIGVEPNPVAREMAMKLGIDHAYPLGPSNIEELKKITNGLGFDVVFEMAGFNSSVNNSIAAVRRGGDVILFGFKSGQYTLDEDYNKLVMKGITMHCVAGRQVWKTWETTRKLMEDISTGVQENLFNIILNRGNGTILPIEEYTKERFEDMMAKHPKFLIQF